MAEPDLKEKEAMEFGDLQGIVRFGHGRMTEACMLLLQVSDAALARQWLRALDVSTAQEQTPRPEMALQVAFTAPGLLALGLDESVVAEFSAEFVAGMTEPNRARRLGDVGANAPPGWRWGGNEAATPHILLMLYAVPGRLHGWHDEVCGDGFSQAFFELQHFRTNQYISSEPFGFADGISQPNIDWSRTQSTDVHRRDDYSNLLALGEVVLGYGNEYGQYTPRPLLHPGDDTNAQLLPEAEDTPGMKDLGRNGSYLVFRQLQQDVPGFWQFVNRSANYHAEQRELLATAMVGRKRDGAPLVQLAPRLIDGIDKHQDKNNFNYDNDGEGLACPIASHVRRSNPRTGDFPPAVNGLLSRLLSMLGFAKDSRARDLVASSRFHRILRRGRQYGEPMTPEEALQSTGDNAGNGGDGRDERGLHFICLNANLARQFEFVQNAWAVNARFAGLQNEEDPLIGNRTPLADGSPTDNFSRPRLNGVRQCVSGLPRFVTVLGGAYFFLPGIRALQYIAAEKEGETS